MRSDSVVIAVGGTGTEVGVVCDGGERDGTAVGFGSPGWDGDPAMVWDHGAELEEDDVEEGRMRSPLKSRAWRQGRSQG